ncbi:hypothetical protein QP365_08980 [Corynebacterium aurimucosum]|nr:hypothetical protein [Corynebacterium aurimucosum]NJJ83747.1 hypothetical protein [Corynebacterium aurimucosum]
MLKFEHITGLNVEGVAPAEDLIDSIREALAEGGDPAPGLALALVKAIAELETAKKSIADLEERMESTQLYVIGLETRLVESGLRFGDPAASINPSDTPDGESLNPSGDLSK